MYCYHFRGFFYSFSYGPSKEIVEATRGSNLRSCEFKFSAALILSTFMIGSITRAFDNLDLSVPPIRWICVLPSDVTGLKHIPTTPVSSRDRTTLKNLHHLYHSDKSKRTQAGIFVDLLENEYNVNIDAVIDYYGGVEQYMIPKIPEMVVIKKKSKKKIQETQLVEV